MGVKGIREKVTYIMKKLLAVLGFAMVLACIPVSGFSQYLRNSYFMEGSSARMNLNPALAPSRGYINLPVIGAFGVEVNSSSLGAQDVIDIIEDENDAFYTSDAFMQKLNAENTLAIKMNTDLLSFGWHKDKSFISFGVGAKTNVDAQIPKSMFQYLYDMENEQFIGSKKYDIRNEKLNVQAYTEVALGYARQLNDRLTIGGKAKVLMGVANLNLNVNRLGIDAYIPDSYQTVANSYADITTDVELGLSGKGIELELDGDGYIEDVKFDKFGIGGYGAAVDLGLSFNLTDNLALSASIIDLGFISWSESASKVYTSKGKVFREDITDTEILDFETFGLKEGVNEARTTKLCPIMVFGGEFSMLHNKIGVGILSTTRFGEIENYSELTAMATFRPSTLLNLAVSYSLLQGSDTFGLALKLGPLMVGTDYMFLSDNTKQVNAYFGLSIPLGKKE